MRSFFKTGRSSTKSQHNINLYPGEGAQHPDLPLSPNPQPPASPPLDASSINRRPSLDGRFSSAYAGDRRSIAVEPGYEPSLPFSPDDITQEPAQGLTRSQTVLRGAGVRKGESSNGEPSPLWAPDLSQLREHPEARQPPSTVLGGAPMSQYNNPANTPGKTSSDSGQSSAALDRWSQRGLRRLNTEQGFREQRQGGQSLYSPPPSIHENNQSSYNYSTAGNTPYNTSQDPQPPQYASVSQAQPHPSQQAAYQSERTAPANANAPVGSLPQPVSSSTARSNNYPRPDASPPYVAPVSQYSPNHPDLPAAPQDTTTRPSVLQNRSYTQQQQLQQLQGGAEEVQAQSSMSSSNNNGNLPAPKASRAGSANRQSMHNGISSREGTALSAASSQQTSGQQQQQAQGVPAFSASVVPPAGQASQQSYSSNPTPQPGEVGRKTPQPLPTSDEMTEDDVSQLIKDHKELREKYTKVKKYYFEKEDQVKQLQNSLAHQRLSQSRTSLDDSEYTTRFNRLDGLVAQLAFSIRKSWKSIPSWLISSVNKDAVATGKQEMTAAGRAFISCWLVEEVFDKYFHPDLDPMFSSQLKGVQRDIRRFAPPAQTAEEEEYLTSKVVNWRLSTLEGLNEVLRSPQCAAHRARLTDMLKENLIAALSMHLQEPPPSDLEGGVHMIIELVVSIAIHLPLESRDVVIDYFMPGYSILHDQMKLESGIPPLTISIAEDAAERGSLKSGDDSEDEDGDEHERAGMRGMLSALTGGKPKSSGGVGDPRKAGAGGSSSSLNRPDSSQGGNRQDLPPRVRMAAGIGVQIRGRSVLVKAPVFATS